MESLDTCGRNLVLCRKVVSISKLDLQAKHLNPEVDAIEECDLQEVKSVILPIQNAAKLTERKINGLSRCSRITLDKYLTCSFYLCPLLEAILYSLLSFGCTLLFCPLSGY